MAISSTATLLWVLWRRVLQLPPLALGNRLHDSNAKGTARSGRVGRNPCPPKRGKVIRDWVLRFNAAGPDGLVDRKAPGPEPRLNEDHRAALAAAIESGPIPAIHSVVRWRLVDLCQWLWEEFRVSIARQTLSRELRSLGYRKLTARPRHHAQAERAIEHFKKVSLPSWQRSRRTNASSLPR